LKKCVNLLLLITLLLVNSISYAKELPVESFSQLPNHTQPSLSPSGNRIAYIRNYQDPQVAVLTTYDLTTGKRQFVVQSNNEESKISWFEWANEKTIIASVRYASRRNRVDVTETRLLAIDIDGEKSVQRKLINPNRFNKFGKSTHISQFQDDVVSFLPDQPDYILLALDKDIPNLPSVYKLNINTGSVTRLIKGKLHIRDWMADQQGTLRLGQAVNYKSGEASTRVRIGDDDTWHKMFEYNMLTEPSIYPVGFAKDPNILYYKAYKDDKKALYTIDLTTKESTLVFADKEYDVDGSLIYSRKTREVIGVRHSNSPNGKIYWDKNIKNFQKSLDTALPDIDNYLVDFSQDENTYLLYTENDYTPGAYYLGNREKQSLHLLFEQYPQLIPEVLSEHKLVTYKTRDGLEIEGYLTMPLDSKGPVATIIHPHGGPGARENDGFDYWTSFFANRGYAVFRPNFRGSTGYGYEFSQSQMKGWGLEMQDDLTDATKWLIQENIADPKNICIVGASYGGYAATMAAVKTPDLFKCAISFAGVTDLKLIVCKSRNYVNSKFVKNQIGEDSDDLKARSPYYHAKKVQIPMLFMHGEKDRVVDVEQSRDMVEELKDLGKKVEYLEFENGDHYLSIQRNRHAAFKAMDDFLKKHLTLN
jgi:dipeptidyl aminopeptidase/acylaminoacyl peptidase